MRRALGAWWVRLGLRRQLVLVISGIFVLAGALLLLAQYMVLQNLLVEHITLVRSENPVVVPASPDGPPPGPHGTGEAQSGGAQGAGAHSGPASRVITTGTGGGLETREEWRFWLASTPFSATILARLQLWSVLLLAVFIICTILAAHMVTRAVMARIDALARATASITERNLSRRLATDGPEDEVRHLAEGVNVMVARLEDAFARQESFVSNAAHELRTPLTTVRTTLQVAGRQGRIPEDLRPDIDEVLLANRYLEGLVSSLLALSRLGGRSISTHDQVDLAALVEDVRRQEDMCRGVPIRVRGAGGPARLRGDSALLTSLVRNLLVNACTHNAARAAVDVCVGPDAEGRVVLEVANPGGDMVDADEVAHLVEPFHRGGRSRTRGVPSGSAGEDGGHGVGLALVDRIVAAHGAELSLEGLDEGGLRVRVRFPGLGDVPVTEPPTGS